MALLEENESDEEMPETPVPSEEVSETQEKDSTITYAVIPAEAEEDRRTGWCSKWNDIENEGLLVDDATGEEHPVLPDDILSADQQRLHVFETLEYTLMEEDGIVRARYITKPDKVEIRFQWRVSQRRGREPPINKTRYVGYIERLEKHHGFVVFKTEKFKNMYFAVKELQTTGSKTVPYGCEVEFSVKRSKDGKKQAKNLTRVGGGLMTVETGELGRMLRENNTKRQDKPDLKPTEEVQTGVVGNWFSRMQTGHIWPCDGSKVIRCKADDIVSGGLKMLAENSTVEFIVVQEDDHLWAKKVTGPGGEPYIDAPPGAIFDHMASIGKPLEEKKTLPIDPIKTVTGWIKFLTSNNEFGYIEPDDPEGFQHVEFTYHQIAWEGAGFPFVPVGTPIEFRTCAWDDGTVRAIKITHPEGDHFMLGADDLAEYEKTMAEHQPPNADEKQAAMKVEEENLPFQDLDIPAPPRPNTLEKLLGFVVDYNLPSLKGILQPLSGAEGGELKELLQFDISQLQCEGFRAIGKWTIVEYSRVVKDEHPRAEYITAVDNMLINFDEKSFVERETNLIFAHRHRMVTRTRNNPGARKQNTRTWMGNIMPFPIGMPPFPPPMMNMPPFPPMMDCPPPFYGGDMGFYPPPFPPFSQSFMPY